MPGVLLAGKQCGVRSSTALPAQFCLSLHAILTDLHVSISSRAHVQGDSACWGLSGPTHHPAVFTAGGLAEKALVVINSIFKWAAARMGAQLSWTSIQVNHGTVANWHVDKGNIGLSMMLVFGDFSGGDFEIGQSGQLPLRGQAILFDGQEQHRSLPFAGDRWSLVAFTSYALPHATAANKLKLQQLAFPIGAPSRPVAGPECRYFLDLCSGAGAPLAFAVTMSGSACLWPMDADQGWRPLPRRARAGSRVTTAAPLRLRACGLRCGRSALQRPLPPQASPGGPSSSSRRRQPVRSARP